MPIDDPSLLPEPPPPRPARRDAAIEAALRRFDGVEGSSARPVLPARQRSRVAFGNRPQYGALVTASLIVAIGLPAALIAIRNDDVRRVPPPPAETAPIQPEAAADAVAVPAPDAATQLNRTGAPSLSAPEPNRFRVLADESPAQPPVTNPAVASDESHAEAAAPPPPPAAPPAPGPAPAPQAGVSAENVQAESDSIVLTGSRIARPSARAERAAELAATAPDWVLQDRTYENFLNRLQAAVRSNDRGAVVRLVSFPLRVNRGGRAISYETAKELLADFDAVFTPKVRRAILDQRFETLFGRDRGVMIGSGEVWFDHLCRNSSCSPPGPVRIKSINP